MHSWSRNDKFAFLGVILAVVGLACGLFGQEIRQGLGLGGPQTLRQAALGSATAAPAERQLPQSATAVMTIRVTGDANLVSLTPSGAAAGGQSQEVSGSRGESSFTAGRKQTVRVELTGDGNTIRVAPQLMSRVTIVDNGDGNKVTH